MMLAIHHLLRPTPPRGNAVTVDHRSVTLSWRDLAPRWRCTLTGVPRQRRAWERWHSASPQDTMLACDVAMTRRGDLGDVTRAQLNVLLR